MGRAVSGARRGREGPSPSTCKCGTRGGLPGEGWSRHRRPSLVAPTRPPSRPAPAEITTPRLRHVERGRPTPAAARALTLPTRCRLPGRSRGTLSVDCPRQRCPRSKVARAGRAREDQVVRGGAGRQLRLFLVSRKEILSSHSVKNVSFRNPTKTKVKDGHDPQFRLLGVEPYLV